MGEQGLPKEDVTIKADSPEEVENIRELLALSAHVRLH
jgi:hypothetical protein